MAHRLAPAGIKTVFGDRFEFYSVHAPLSEINIGQRQPEPECRRCPSHKVCVPRPPLTQPGLLCYQQRRQLCEAENRSHHRHNTTCRGSSKNSRQCKHASRRRSPSVHHNTCCEKRQPKCKFSPRNMDPGMRLTISNKQKCTLEKKVGGCWKGHAKGPAKRQHLTMDILPNKCPSVIRENNATPTRCPIMQMKRPCCCGQKIICHY